MIIRLNRKQSSSMSYIAWYDRNWIYAEPAFWMRAINLFHRELDSCCWLWIFDGKFTHNVLYPTPTLEIFFHLVWFCIIQTAFSSRVLIIRSCKFESNWLYIRPCVCSKLVVWRFKLLENFPRCSLKETV